MKKTRILVVDDEESILFTFHIFLTDEGYEVVTTGDWDEATAFVKESYFDLIFIDIILEGKSGIELLRAVKESSPNTSVIMITGAPSIETAMDALRLGALDYIVKPVRQEALLRATSIALQHNALRDEKEDCLHNLEAIFRSVKDGIVMVDTNLTVEEMNQAAAEICQIPRIEAIGKQVDLLLECCEGKCVAAMRQAIRSRKPVEHQYIECRAGHNRRQVVSVTASPLLDSSGDLSGAVMVIRDETRLVSLERSLRGHREFHSIVGMSEGVQRTNSLIRDLAEFRTTVLITGESGTGKEMVVDALHRAGPRHDKPLVKVNCAALPESLLESELFGHVSGAFTGAVKDKIGRFQRANGGIIFLDEIGDTSLLLQLRLLRVIETMEFERVGDSSPVRVDVRVVAATNQNLQERVSRGKFREDLYYRLKVAEIQLPPLRDRQDDIPILVHHFLEEFNKKFERNIKGVSVDVEKLFLSHRWPGNIRELKNTIEYAFVRSRGNVITSDHLPADFMRMLEESSTPLWHTDEEEIEAIRRALSKTSWNKSRAAELLGMSRRTIYRKMEKYGITTAA